MSIRSCTQCNEPFHVVTISAGFVGGKEMEDINCPSCGFLMDRMMTNAVITTKKLSPEEQIARLGKQAPEALTKLKNEWQADPCWDLEDTDGFEAHRDELLAYRLECEAKWTAEKQAQLEKRAELLGCPGNVKLAQYVVSLEYRLDRLVERLETVETSHGFR